MWPMCSHSSTLLMWSFFIPAIWGVGGSGGRVVSLQPHLEILEFSQQYLSMDSLYSCEGDCNLERFMLLS